ncbi:membrane associated rhomboid family serine protease [Geothermobacter ehrlichii]|uniref:Membrane associated rhomboid family serine protease n=1 Tax=Geothermobacter ehrlichii TaxID=213224 RepID=A0A5D3WJZ8_9BACT|nr:rhomboid family intramembrane serine protease [Geothermobacter ehrlichii]TYO96387.1 membrane associated rhomboid family serine protease [Geothermobacter ehrlichii]
MLLPIGDNPNPRSTPWMTWLLIAVNVAVFLLVTLPLSVRRPDLADPVLLDYLRSLGVYGQVSIRSILASVSAYDLFVFKYGFRPAQPSLVSLFSAMFLHGGWMHLLGNMLFLWIFGDNVEHRLGRIRFLLAYLATGIAATLFFALFVPGSQVPLVGASGAISGVLGFYFVWFPRNKVKMFFFFFFLLQVIEVPARLVLGFYLVVDNLLPFLLTGGSGGGVAYGAHIGGFLAGAGLALWSDRMGLSWRMRRHLNRLWREQPDETPPVRSVAELVNELLAAGDLPRAALAYLQLDSRSERLQVAPADVLAIGDFLLERRRADEALTVFRRFIAERPADPGLSRAYLGAGRAMLLRPRCRTSAYHYFLGAIDTARSRGDADAARRYLALLQAGGRED